MRMVPEPRGFIKVNSMTIPYDDWQFWVVTVAMLLGAYVMVRPFLPRRGGEAGNGGGGGGSCPHCAMGGAATKRKSRPGKTRLTIEGQRSQR